MAIETNPSEGDLSSAATVVARALPHPHLAAFGNRLRPGEKIALGFLTYALMAALIFHLSFSDVSLIAALNFTAATVILLLSEFQKTNGRLCLVRDWFPAALVLLAYRESGLFLQPDLSHHLDYVFVSWDRHLLQNRLVAGLLSLGSPWLQYYFELSYLLCYPLVPLGLGVLYLAGDSAAGENHRKTPALAKCAGVPVQVGEGSALPRRGECSAFPCTAAIRPEPRPQPAIGQYWTAVLMATLTCYALYPLFPLTPPRILFHDLQGPAVEPLLRKVNFWILDRYSVQACIFPSGHVAAVTAAALSVRAHLPRWGGVFLFLAASVAMATVYGRYHYAADALAGALVGLGAFFIAFRLHIPGRPRPTSICSS